MHNFFRFFTFYLLGDLSNIDCSNNHLVIWQHLYFVPGCCCDFPHNSPCKGLQVHSNFSELSLKAADSGADWILIFQLQRKNFGTTIVEELASVRNSNREIKMLFRATNNNNDIININVKVHSFLFFRPFPAGNIFAYTPSQGNITEKYFIYIN